MQQETSQRQGGTKASVIEVMSSTDNFIVHARSPRVTGKTLSPNDKARGVPALKMARTAAPSMLPVHRVTSSSARVLPEQVAALLWIFYLYLIVFDFI